MCLIPKESAKIAKKDIVVYKILFKYPDGSYVSPFRGTIYQIGELKTANIKYDKRLLPFYCRETYDTVITKGLHAYIITEETAISYARSIATTMIIVKAIIPKGAMYVLGFNDEIVSTQLKLIEECEK